VTERKGQLKIFLGYAAGVGKTFRMLSEAQALRATGVDLVIGYLESHGRAETAREANGLEVVPRRTIRFHGRNVEEMDTNAILARRPAVCLVDELPHHNVEGSHRAKRWQDVAVLLDAGIDVWTTMNIQHLESLNDQVRELVGLQVKETVPDWILREAADVVLVDLTPEALLNRLSRGAVYPPDQVLRAQRDLFREPTLAALREMALRQIAHELDIRQDEPAETGATAGAPEARESILIYVTPSAASSGLIRRGRRVADYLKANCFAVGVLPPAVPGAMREAIEEHLAFARSLRIETTVLEADDAARTVVAFAREHGVTQILVKRPRRSAVPFLFDPDVSQRIVGLAHDMQVMVVAERGLPPPVSAEE
jgi:two-component system sensor histidine kinase KdpD